MYHIQWHNARVNRTLHELFGITSSFNLRKYITVPDQHRHGLVKCRVTYDRSGIQDISYQSYSIRQVDNCAVTSIPQDITYHHKWIQRDTLDVIRAKVSTYDEVIMIRGGMVTDAYYYNIVIQENGLFYTPETHLLPGVMRAKLLAQEKIKVSQISINRLYAADAVYFINALTPLGQLRVGNLYLI